MRELVLGIGNILLKDEGIGCHIVHALEKIPCHNIKIMDRGTCPNVMQFVEDTDKSIAVDATKRGGIPGEVYRFKPDDIALEQKPFLVRILKERRNVDF